jgi:hypothetical protein
LRSERVVDAAGLKQRHDLFVTDRSALGAERDELALESRDLVLGATLHPVGAHFARDGAARDFDIPPEVLRDRGTALRRDARRGLRLERDFFDDPNEVAVVDRDLRRGAEAVRQPQHEADGQHRQDEGIPREKTLLRPLRGVSRTLRALTRSIGHATPWV